MSAKSKVYGMCLGLEPFLLICCGSLKQNWDVEGSYDSWFLKTYVMRIIIHMYNIFKPATYVQQSVTANGISFIVLNSGHGSLRYSLTLQWLWPTTHRTHRNKRLPTDCLVSAKTVLKSIVGKSEVFLHGSCGSLVQISKAVNNATSSWSSDETWNSRIAMHDD